MGTSTSQRPSRLPAGDTIALLQRWKKKRLVNSPISLRRASAMKALASPIPTARQEIHTTRGVVVKSPNFSNEESAIFLVYISLTILSLQS